MPGLFRCRSCKQPTVRPAVSTIYSRANACGEKCYTAFRERRNAQHTARAGRKPRLHKPGRVSRPKPEPQPVVVAAVPVVDPVDEVFERAVMLVESQPWFWRCSHKTPIGAFDE